MCLSQLTNMGLQGVITNGSIILFVGSNLPPEYITPMTSAGDQPADQKIQGYPQLRGLLLVHSTLKPEMGVSIDELMQP